MNKTPDFIQSLRRARRKIIRAFAIKSTIKAITVLMFFAMLGANLVALFYITGGEQVHASTTSFTETFASTTYKDSSNTTGTWLGSGSTSLGFSGTSTAAHQILNAPLGWNDIGGISCANASVCYAFSAWQVGVTIYKTSDGGSNWEQVYGGELDPLHLNANTVPYNILAVDASTVFLVGKMSNNGWILKTTDGGATWADSSTGLGTDGSMIQGIACQDSNTCVVVGERDYINSGNAMAFYTTDGGANWTESASMPVVATSELWAVDFYNDGSSSTWRAVGEDGVMMVSEATSSPEVWYEQSSGTGGGGIDLRGIEMADYNFSYLAGGYFDLNNTPVLMVSSDAGASYTTSTITPTDPVYDVVCDTSTTSTCWAVGGYNPAFIIKTTDSGANWAAVADNATYKLVDIDFVSSSVVYAVGDDGDVVKHSSTSTYFDNINVNALCRYNATGCVSTSLSFPVRGMWMDPSDGQTIYISGDTGSTGYVGKSTDGGDTWAFTTNDNPGRINEINCIDATNCWGGGVWGVFFKTTDGGDSWTTTSTAATSHLYEIQMIDSSNGWAALGGIPSVRRTTDGGTTWPDVHNSVISATFDAFEVYATSTNHALIFGYDPSASNKGLIYYTADGGTTWTTVLDTGTSGAFFESYFLPDQTTGWAMSGSNAFDLYKTTDGGMNWSIVANLTSTIGFDYYTGLRFIDENIGFMGDSDCGQAMFTVDGGATWSKFEAVCPDGVAEVYANTIVFGGDSYAMTQKIIFEYDSSSVIQSTTVDTTSSDIECAGLTPTIAKNGGGATYEMSNDGGSTWTSAVGSCDGMFHSNEYTFASTGSDLRWRATLGRSSVATSTPVLSNVSIDYKFNTVPDTPTNTSPGDGATSVLLTGPLVSSAFSDSDTNDTHKSSRWEITTTSGNYTSPLYSVTSTSNLTSLSIPTGTFENSTTYYWHVRYTDNNDGLSSYSTETSFTTKSSGGQNPAAQNVPDPVFADVCVANGQATSLLCTFKNPVMEAGASIVDEANSNTEVASTKPIFTDNATELTVENLSPATEYCDFAVIAFNDKGNSSVTEDSRFACAWTPPLTPLPPEVLSSTATSITLSGVPDVEGNPESVLYAIQEQTTGLWLAPASGSAIATQRVSIAQTPQLEEGEEGSSCGQYVLSKTPVYQSQDSWGGCIDVIGLVPNSGYEFIAVADNGNGDTASSGKEKGGTTYGYTEESTVVLSVTKSVAINPAQGALAAIGFAINFSVVGLTLLALIGIALFYLLHRKRGVKQCVGGLCRIFAHPTDSYKATVGNSRNGSAFSKHGRVHRYTQLTLAAAACALLIKGGLLAALTLYPNLVLNASGFGDDGQAVIPGDTLVYQVVLKNNGPAIATELKLVDTKPNTTKITPGSLTVDGRVQTDACDKDAACISGDSVILKYDSMAVNEKAVLTFAVVTYGSDGDLISNTACVTSTELPSPTCSNQTTNIVVAEKEKELVPENINKEIITNKNVNITPEPEKFVPPLISEEVLPPEPLEIITPEPILLEPPELEPSEIVVPEQGKSTIQIDGDSPTEPTNNNTPEISGSAVPGSLVAIEVDRRTEGVAFAGPSGQFAFTIDDSLRDGSHTVRIFFEGQEIDSASFVVDTAPPPAPSNIRLQVLRIDVEPRTKLNDTTIRIRGETTPDTSLVRLVLRSDPIEVSFVPPSLKWTKEVSALLEPGEHTVTATAFDRAGNPSAESSETFFIEERPTDAFAATLAILDDPAVEQVSKVAAPTIVVIAAANVAVATGFGTLINFLGLLFTQPTLLFARRRRKGYGTIFNSLSKLPVDLAIVRLRDSETNRIVQTKVTDTSGRYAFTANPGSYLFEVTKQGYTFPSQYVKSTEDIAYTDILLGNKLSLTAAERITKNIPADPTEDTRTPAKIRASKIMKQAQYAFALSGPILSVATLIITPTLTVAGLVVVQFAVFGLFRKLAYTRKPKSFGVIRDAKTRKPINNVVVRLFEPTYNKLVETQVTDARGRYAFLVGQNKYYLAATKDGYVEHKSSELDYTDVEKGGLVARDIKLRAGGGPQTPPKPPSKPVMPTKPPAKPSTPSMPPASPKPLTPPLPPKPQAPPSTPSAPVTPPLVETPPLKPQPPISPATRRKSIPDLPPWSGPQPRTPSPPKGPSKSGSVEEPRPTGKSPTDYERKDNTGSARNNSA